MRLPRQSGKNEILAFLASEHLRRGNGEMLIFAPSYRQTRITYRRIKEHGNTDTSEGHIFIGDNSRIFLITASPTAQIVGLTASAAVIVDEAQDIEEEIFQERILPMTASTNAPILLMGTACANENNMLLRYIRRLPDDQTYQITADQITHPPYQEHVRDVVELYGRRAPFVRTQYYLEDLDASAILWFDPSAIIASDKPLFAGSVVIGIDLGGVVGLGGQTGQGNDLTEIVVAITDGRRAYLMDRLSWRNVPWAQQEQRIRQLIAQYKPSRVMIDARGVGEMLATTLAIQMPFVEAYKASRQSVSSDLYGLGSIIQQGGLSAHPSIRDALIEQIRGAVWDVWSSSGVAAGVSVEKGQGKIDLIKAVTYVVRALPKRGIVPRGELEIPI